jgi:hypothetical protein
MAGVAIEAAKNNQNAEAVISAVPLSASEPSPARDTITEAPVKVGATLPCR